MNDIEVGVRRWPARHPGWIAAALVGVAIAWDVTGLDLTVAGWFGGAAGFPWREQWWLSGLLHDGGRRVAWVIALALCVGIEWPFGPLRSLNRSARLQLAVTTGLAAAVVAAIKSASLTSCPWDLHEFGGVAHLVPHWRGWTVADGGSGRCFPAGHASSGFAFFGGWFVFRERPVVARGWFAAALGAGGVFGLAQQMRGAHFMSHTLWTAVVCWAVAWGVDVVWPEALA